MSKASDRLPIQFVTAVAVAVVAPSILNLFGMRFGTIDEPANMLDFAAFRGIFVHTIMQWTGACLSLITATYAFQHWFLRRDAATPILGTALLFCGLIDAFHVLVADGLLNVIADKKEFVPFTWSMSRVFHSSILAAGAALAMMGRGPSAWVRSNRAPLRTVFLIGLLLGMGAYALISICANIEKLPQAVYPEWPVKRPLNGLALMIYLLAGGILFPRFSRRFPGLFAHGLLLSLIPQIAGEAFAAFGSGREFDNAFYIAQYLKIVGYIVPLAGLLVDYSRASKSEATLRTTEEMLRLARQVQDSLLPKAPPSLPGYEVAGYSYSCAAVGGDFYDFIETRTGAWIVVMGDVSGHDLAASLLMSQTRAYLRAMSAAGMELHEMLKMLNEFLVRDVRNRRFVSLFLLWFDPATGIMQHAGAGQCGYIIDGDGCTRSLNVTGPVMGIHDEPPNVADRTQLAPGEILMFYSDGLTEATSFSGEQFGDRRVFDLVEQFRQRPMEEVRRQICQSVHAHRGGLPLEDDLTIVLLKRAQLEPDAAKTSAEPAVALG